MGSLVDGMRDRTGQKYMRNRYYDPATGQFTQPDPIGIAGGLNTYGFAAGDPVSYSDPYGLTVCFYGTRSERRSLQRETEQAIGASIDVGIDGCVTNVRASSSSGRAEFQNLVNSAFHYGMAYGSKGSYFSPLDRMIWIDPNERYVEFYSLQNGECLRGGSFFTFLPRLVAHELGHAYDANRRLGRTRLYLGGRRKAEYSAMRRENAWARANNQPERCRYADEF